MGVTWERFMDSCPRELKAYENAYKLEANRKDAINWQLGQYILSAIGAAFSKKAKYPEKPVFQIKNEIENNSYKENNEEIAIFEMKQRIRELEKQGLPSSPM